VNVATQRTVYKQTAQGASTQIAKTTQSARWPWREALIARGYSKEELPSERTMGDILNRMNYRLKRIQKGKPLKKTEETDAIFANVKEVKEQARNDPETLEISMDTKAKVGLGDYARGGKNQDRR